MKDTKNTYYIVLTIFGRIFPLTGASRIFSLFYFILFLSCKALFSSNDNINIGNIRITNIPSVSQLPVSAVHRIFQDSEGYMWYGTVNGLCRDDGYKIKVFRSDFHTPDLLNNNVIQCISESESNKIWFGTDRGAYILNKNNYTIYPLDEKNLASSFIIAIWNADGFMWVSINGALHKYDMEGSLVKIYDIKNRNGSPSHVNGFCESRQKELWITVSSNGILKYDSKNDCFVPFNHPPVLYSPTGIIQDNHEDYFWVGTWNNGVIKFNPWTSESETYKKYSLSNNCNGQEESSILYLTQDKSNGYLWFTTSSDLVAMKYDKVQDSLSQIDLRKLLPSRNKMLNELISDKNGNIWVAAFDMPSMIISFGNNAPKEYPLKRIAEKVGYNPAVMSLCDAGGGKIWMSQERTGLCLYDLVTDEVTIYKDCIATRGLPLHSIKQMAFTESKDCVWVIPENSKQIYKLSHKNMSLSLNRKIELQESFYKYFTKVYEENIKNDSMLWIGTDNGLICYSLSYDSVRNEIPGLGNVTSIKPDEYGFLWVATSNKGIYRIKESNVIQNIQFPKNISCLDILDNHLWIGTNEGQLLRFEINTGEMKNFTDICGLNGDIINHLTIDVYKHIWIGTNSRLIEYNPANNSQYSYLTSDDSFLLDRFIPTAMCVAENGKLLFGGIPGVCSFSPSDRLDNNEGNSIAIITDVIIKEESAFFGDFRNRNYTGNNLILSKNNNSVTISFSSLDHLNHKKIRYAYRLKGFEDEWNYTSVGSNSATYKHLPKGDYVFEVKATDKYGVWSKNITSLYIKRLPAFHETWWAKLLFLTSVSLLIAFPVWNEIKKRAKKNEELYADSLELSKLREYLVIAENKKRNPDIKITETEIVQLDELLLQKILKAVERNMSEPDFDVSVLSSKVGMSRSSLTRKLKSITGLTPLEYIKKIKMQHAKILLEDHSKTIAEIALALGYFNRKHFTQCFKDEFGITPSEYQKNLFESNNKG